MSVAKSNVLQMSDYLETHLFEPKSSDHLSMWSRISLCIIPIAFMLALLLNSDTNG